MINPPDFPFRRRAISSLSAVIFSPRPYRRRYRRFRYLRTKLLAVPGRGLEPPRIAPPVPKTGAYTNSATRAFAHHLRKYIIKIMINQKKVKIKVASFVILFSLLLAPISPAGIAGAAAASISGKNSHKTSTTTKKEKKKSVKSKKTSTKTHRISKKRKSKLIEGSNAPLIDPSNPPHSSASAR